MTIGWFTHCTALQRLQFLRSITEETGLRLPPHARIAAARAHLLSLADGANFEWLIESDISLLPWASASMLPERGGWEHIRHPAELGDFREVSRDLKFGGVWKAIQRGSHGREETSYLYLAEEGRLGILATFRP